MVYGINIEYAERYKKGNTPSLHQSIQQWNTDRALAKAAREIPDFLPRSANSLTKKINHFHHMNFHFSVSFSFLFYAKNDGTIKQ